MLTREQNERFTRVGAGTPCGELMRRCWHPVAASAQLPTRGTRQVRLLGETLVLYRGDDGHLGLVEPRCPHRGASLLYGIPEHLGLRCPYHGWMFDPEGKCLEQPYEIFSNPESRYRDKVKIKAYPLEELGGLIFAYLGPEPRPLLPRWEPFVIDNVFREIGIAIIPCNWLQTVENAGDTSHVVTGHYKFSNYVLEKLGRHDLQRHENSSGAKGFMESKDRQIGAHGVGAVIFPYTDAQSDITYQMRIPVDDTHTMHIWYTTFDADAEKELGVNLPPQRDPRDIPVFDVPVPRIVEGVESDWSTLDSNCAQDMLYWISQGEIYDRTREMLGAGDRNIMQLRKLLEAQIQIVEAGGDPINTFRDPAANTCLRPDFRLHMRPRTAPDGRPDRTNAARKYSPVYQQATIARMGPDALQDPAH
jgi:5,5'-dehydrodivanillate O-demethylase